MTTRQIIEDFFDRYARDSVPSEHVDELVESLDTLFRDTAKRSYSDFAHNATEEEKKQVITKAINEANEEQRKEVK